MSVNWLAGREQLVGIAPKAARTFTLNLSDRQMNEIVLLTVAGIPMLIALLGLGTSVERQSSSSIFEGCLRNPARVSGIHRSRERG